MSKGRIIGIYLAAGRSSRMGKNKLDLPLLDDCLGGIALKTIMQTDLDFTIVITSTSEVPSWITPPLLLNKKWCSFLCTEAEKGQAYSLRCGVMKAMSMEADAVIVFLADQPLISRQIIHQLIHTYTSNRDLEVVASSFNGISRPPILFSHQVFPKLLELEGDIGARQLLKKSKRKVCIEFNDEVPFMDVDNEEDYSLIRKLTMGRDEN